MDDGIFLQSATDMDLAKTADLIDLGGRDGEVAGS
jgi:hypothetical protein